MTNLNYLHSLIITLLFLSVLSLLSVNAQDFQDSLPTSKKENNAQAAAMPLDEKTLEEQVRENTLLLLHKKTTENNLNSTKRSIYSFKNTLTPNKQNTALPHVKSEKKQLKRQRHLNKKQRISSSKSKQKNTWGGLHLNFKWIELDWFMVGLAIVLFMGLMLLLYFLFVGNTLSIFEMILFAMGFGFAMFSFIFLSSEADGERAAYEFFIKYGIFSWAGIMAIIAGFAGLFGATGSFWSFILIGLIIGGISFVLSLLLGDHLFMGYEQRKRN